NLPPECKIEYYPSGYFLWLKLPKNVDSMQVYEVLIQQNIGIAPGQLFNITAQKQHYLRMNCSFEWTDSVQHSLDQVIATLQGFIMDE
ncbi:MAG: transcriptional regulator, partial [Acinetobacter sp.]|nr:transcriptional regulator [Acinetobacter sp.]